MNTKETKKSIIQAGHKAVEELIKVAKEAIVDSDDDISADRLKNAAATKKLAIFDAFEILNRIEEEKNLLRLLKKLLLILTLIFLQIDLKMLRLLKS